MNDRLILDEVIETIAQTLQLTAEEIVNLRQEAGYKKLRKWTSARHAEIIVALEDRFNLEIDELAIPQLNSAIKIAAYIQTKLDGDTL